MIAGTVLGPTFATTQEEKAGEGFHITTLPLDFLKCSGTQYLFFPPLPAPWSVWSVFLQYSRGA